MTKNYNFKTATEDDDPIVLVESGGERYIPNLYGDPDFANDLRLTTSVTGYDIKWECGRLLSANLYKQIVRSGGKVARRDIDCDDLDKLLYVAPDAPLTRVFVDAEEEKWVAVRKGNGDRPLFSLSFSPMTRPGIDSSYGLFFRDGERGGRDTVYTYEEDSLIRYLNDKKMIPLSYSQEDSIVKENLTDLGDICDILGVGECFRIARRTFDKRLTVRTGNGRGAADLLFVMAKLESHRSKWRTKVWGMAISTVERKSLFSDKLYERLDDFRRGDHTDGNAEDIHCLVWRKCGTQLHEDADAACALIGVKNLDDIKNGKVADEYPTL